MTVAGCGHAVVLRPDDIAILNGPPSVVDVRCDACVLAIDLPGEHAVI